MSLYFFCLLKTSYLRTTCALFHRLGVTMCALNLILLVLVSFCPNQVYSQLQCHSGVIYLEHKLFSITPDIKTCSEGEVCTKLEAQALAKIKILGNS